MTNAESALASALDQLAALGTDLDREQIAALRDRLDAARLRVLVAGEAKRGKSTLINALLGRAVLPAGVTPLTAVATTVRYGDDPRAEVRFADGHEEKQPLSALPDLVAERGNPGNRRHVAAVTVYLDAPVLAGGVELVDTPGTGSVFAWDTAAAHDALETMDAAVFVLTADPPVSAAERDLYAKVSGLSVATFTVLNKADYLDEGGWPGAADRRAFEAVRTRRSPGATRVAHAVSDLAEPAVVYPVLALAGVIATRRNGWWRAGAPCIAVASGAAARRRLSRLIARPRPPASAWLIEPEGFSLPSKHTTLAVLAAGATARALGVRGGPLGAATLLAGAGIGASRVYLGVHWPTDVIAGWLFAEGWLRVTHRD